jgi:hypothetical protein
VGGVHQPNLRRRGGLAPAAPAPAEHKQSAPENPSSEAILHSRTHCSKEEVGPHAVHWAEQNLLGERLRACNQL